MSVSINVVYFRLHPCTWYDVVHHNNVFKYVRISNFLKTLCNKGALKNSGFGSNSVQKVKQKL